MNEDILYYIKKYKWYGIVIGGIVVVIGSLFLFFKQFFNTANTTPLQQTQQVTQQIVVDIKGAVVKPGVYTFPPNSRVNDAIEKAGGFLENADVDHVNLSQLLVDEMAIIVNVKGEAVKVEQSSGKININTATKEQLLSLNGIGESKANAIIAYRTKKRLTSIEELLQIKGISKKLLDKLKNDVVVK